jgi:hypothetical protein
LKIQRCGEKELEAIERFWALYREKPGLEERLVDERERLRHLRVEGLGFSSVGEFANPFANGEGSVWLAWSEGQPVAHLCRSLCPAYHKGRRIDSGWWRDLFAVADSVGGHAAAALALNVAHIDGGHAGLGTPGVESQAGRLYRALRFDYWGAVPFLYHVIDGARLLRNLSVFKRNQFSASVAHIASHLYFPGKVIALRHRRRPTLVSPVRVEPWNGFPADADWLWDRVVKRFSFVFDRSTPYLNWRYAEDCYTRCGVFAEDQLIGWVVWKLTGMKSNWHFGNLTVGTVVDLLADPDNPTEVRTVLRVALDELTHNGADLVVTNLSDQRMLKAASEVGFISGPSNYHFFTKNLPTLKLEECHLTRGDSDGDRRL